LIYFEEETRLTGMSLLTTKEVAVRLGVTLPRVHTFIKEGRLPAEKLGRDFFIKEEDLRLVENRKTGRPPNPKPPATKASRKRGGKK
jgi:excisionase family DNA binding protein